MLSARLCRLLCCLLLGWHILLAPAQDAAASGPAATALEALEALPPSPGVQVLRQADLSVRLRSGAAAPAEIRAFDLPLHWDVLYRRQSGWATARLAFDLSDAQRQQPQALLIPRLGNAYRVTLNGEVVAAGGKLREPNDGWRGRRPLWIHLPSPLLHEHNVLSVTIRADYLRRAGISALQLGSPAVLEERWHALEWQRITLPRAISLFSLVVGIFCLLLWWQQRQPLYAYAALCELLWSCRIASLWIEDIPLSWPHWFQVTLGLFWAGSLSLYWLVRAVWGKRPRVETCVAWTLFSLWPLAALLGTAWVLAWVVALSSAWAVLVLRLARELGRDWQTSRVWILLALSVCWVAFVRDAVAARLATAQYVDGGWTLWASTLTGVAVLAIVGQHFQQVRQQLLELTASLEQRVLQRENELLRQHEALRTLERASARSEERTRILRDMHDGAGAHLITAMRQLEGGVTSQAQVMQTLRESLDQLRLSVDAMSLPVGDINALLSSLRFRLEPRIRDSGLALLWDVEPLPLWPLCSDEAMRHLQYIVFEAVSNVLQHARAEQMTLTARADERAITIHLRDDGAGMQNNACGNGLRTMHERAALIGATLAVRPEAGGGTGMHVSLPMHPTADS